jgi:hypothetical protein
VQKGLDVHRGAADGDDLFAGGLNLCGGGAGQFEKAIHAEGFARLDYVDEVIWNFPAFFERRLGRADVHAAIDLHGVHADDLAAQPVRHFKGQRAFAGGGDAENQDFF